MKHQRKKTEKSKIHNFKNYTKKAFKKLKCSPKSTYDFTCYNKKSIDKIKQLWNLRHPDIQILTNNSREIWDSLKHNMQNICSNEKCWLNQKFMKNNLDKILEKHTFAPKAPSSWNKNPTEWLSSVDINQIMLQYEYKYPSFIFIGPSPIDFDKKKLFGQCVWNELCNFNLKEHIKNKKNKIGIIFNTDPHYLEGSHWICMFIDIKNKFIFYFDSNADKTPKQINKLVKRITSQGNKLNIDFKFHTNKTQHQRTNTECGMYVLYVISQLLQEKMTPYSFNKRIPDKYMKELRKVLFN